ncbi:hypothetical protein D9615_005664 [Tricholomella constricta]|uniref:C2H2-type domain-containing protein n=1 Tax=Tricholomella constricta TaxID=117010 RepID=A0A8H5HAU1_9AGAR|nr:hypothetical protein D9615_005664 [Tricholomella constricta]
MSKNRDGGLSPLVVKPPELRHFLSRITPLAMARVPKSFKPKNILCPTCRQCFSSRAGLSNHRRIHRQNEHLRQLRFPSAHPQTPSPPPFDESHSEFASPRRSTRPAVRTDGATSQREETVYTHPFLNGCPRNSNGALLMPNQPPPAAAPHDPDDFTPFTSRAAFKLSQLLYTRSGMSQGALDELFQCWAAITGQDPPFASAEDMNETIDSIELGGVRWSSFTVQYSGDLGEGEPVPWKAKAYPVYFRDPLEVLHEQLGNPDFVDEMDHAPKKVFDKDGTRRYQNLMSSDWAWRHADKLAQDPDNHDATFCPIILGSDKTTVSVATGHNEYYPLYMSNGLVHNNVRRAHRNALTLIGFLAIPKTDREHQDSVEFRKFRRSLFHASLIEIFRSLRPYMEKPELVRYGDGYYRNTIYGLGPYIADYPEQALLACIVQGWCPRCTAPSNNLDGKGGRRSHELTLAVIAALDVKTLWEQYGIVSDLLPFTHSFPFADIHELIALDLLHQIIKGIFKDHLVTWVEDYIKLAHTAAEAKKILADIDRRIAAAPPFPGVRRFPEGRGFKQWTGDDSKALMKVYLPAIAGHVPSQMVRALSTFTEFCYLVRREVLDENDLQKLDELVELFHQERTIFEQEGVRPDGFSLPRQHSMVHYTTLIREFGAPNGLCSSITESKHIKAVKKPYRRTNRDRETALGQMLVINQRQDKLAAAHVNFQSLGMLAGSLFGPPDVVVDDAMTQRAGARDTEDDDGGAVDGHVLAEVKLASKAVSGLPRELSALSRHLNLPQLPALVSRFLYEQTHPELDVLVDDIPLDRPFRDKRDAPRAD